MIFADICSLLFSFLFFFDQIPLPYRVLLPSPEARGPGARFDRRTRVLTVTLNIAPLTRAEKTQRNASATGPRPRSGSLHPLPTILTGIPAILFSVDHSKRRTHPATSRSHHRTAVHRAGVLLHATGRGGADPVQERGGALLARPAGGGDQRSADRRAGPLRRVHAAHGIGPA